MNLGNNIAVLRRQKSFTQEQLAELCNVSRQSVTKWEAGISEPSIDKLVKLGEIFQVSLDELIKGKEIKICSKENDEVEEENFKKLAWCIASFRGCTHGNSSDYLMLEAEIISYLNILLDIMNSKYIGSDGKVYEKYLLKNTTEDERKKYANLIDRCQPINKYIYGECEIDEALAMAEEELHNEFSQIYDVEMKKKEESTEGKIYKHIKEIVNKIKISSILNEKKQKDKEKELKESLNQLQSEIIEYGDDTVIGRFWMFLEQEVISVYENGDNQEIDEFRELVRCLKDFIWQLIPVEEEQMRRKKYDDYMEERRENCKR